MSSSPDELPATFAELLGRLRADLLTRMANGEFTERGLARIAGISQPHIHHVFSGQRSLTPAVADVILAALGLSLREILSSGKLS